MICFAQDNIFDNRFCMKNSFDDRFCMMIIHLCMTGCTRDPPKAVPSFSLGRKRLRAQVPRLETGHHPDQISIIVIVIIILIIIIIIIIMVIIIIVIIIISMITVVIIIIR